MSCALSPCAKARALSPCCLRKPFLASCPPYAARVTTRRSTSSCIPSSAAGQPAAPSVPAVLGGVRRSSGRREGARSRSTMNSTRMFCGGGGRGGGRCRVGGRGQEASGRAGEGCAVLSEGCAVVSVRSPGRGPPRHWPCCGAAGPPPAAAPGRACPRSSPPPPPCLPCRPRAAAAPRRTARPAARQRARCRRAAASRPHRSCGRTCRAAWERRGPRGRGVRGVRGVRAMC